MRVDLAKFSNPDYQPGGTLKRGIWFFLNKLFIINKYNPSSGLRKFILRLFGAKIGTGVVIKPGVNIKYPWFLSIGNYSWIGEDVWIDNLGKVQIGSNVCISQGALLLCGNHNYKKEKFDLMVGDIVLEDGVWIGAKALVTGGVVCETHAVLSAGSVTSKNLNSYSIYQGNPSRFVRERTINK
ncbi:WcaF family extracellular polysaccharide biosynthesis acetyltransferase [Crocinitomix algicola]|uniref:WcaF family extracellular polysaccharide biosynthesis acetyltransferase n=1 Tax=Crocinitomix algicola TaxID=1740263 RepID=UPI0008317439|nr:WcaF family extracellular polysaccharide biosynthesis acetyltransferase [Crocinitomix algicola]